MVITIAVIACAGLVFDGGRLVSAKISAADHADNAARAGAQAVSVGSGGPLIDPLEAHRRAQAYLSSAGVSGTVVATPTGVSVTVTAPVPMTLLAVAGVGTKTVSAPRSAE
ncbi:MAG TPA: pilus assembly protein TadG-related protein, partial [Ilumatobacteraceae bacterium]|nr:pilus assembly protein TadG-related protein [Ilumatobacteraceae bacterium]